MAWLSRIDFTPTDVLHADDINNLGNDIRSWSDDVNGGGHHLYNVIIDGMLLDPTNIKGDMLVRSDFGIEQISVGPDGFVLVADSADRLGVKWAAPASAIPPDDTSTQKIIISKAGAAVGTRRQLNFIEGTGVTLNIADDAANNRVNITVNRTPTPLTPWTSDVNAAGFALLSAGGLYVGTAAPVGPVVAGRSAIAVRGSAGAGRLEVSATLADADATSIGYVDCADANNGSADKRIASVVFQTEGATALNRGGRILFQTKPDNGALGTRMVVTQGGRVLIGTTADDGINALQVQGSIIAKSDSYSQRQVADNNGVNVVLQKRGRVGDVNGMPANNGALGNINIQGWNGTSYVAAGLIQAVANEDWTATKNGTNLNFFATAAGSAGFGLVMTLANAGSTIYTPLYVNAAANFNGVIGAKGGNFSPLSDPATPMAATTLVVGEVSGNPDYQLKMCYSTFGSSYHAASLQCVNGGNPGALLLNAASGLVIVGMTQATVPVATAVGTGMLVNGSFILNTSAPPATSVATGYRGQLTWDVSYLYLCIGTNTWRRVALAAF